MFTLLMTMMLGATPPDRVMRVVVAPAETLHVEVSGTGPVVVLLPGLFGSAYAYRSVVERLVMDGRRAIVIEPLGLGSSSRPRGADYSLTAQADRVAAVLDSLGVSDAVVVSHAVGTGIALRLALRRAPLVKSVLSLGGGVVESAAAPSLRQAVSLAPLIRLIGGAGIRKRVRSSLIESSGDPTWVSDAVIAAYTGYATANIGATLGAFRGMVESREETVLAPRLGDLQCDVVLLLGGAIHHGRVDEREVAQLRRDVHSFSLEMVPGAGSYRHEERPELVAAVVGRMLLTRPTAEATSGAAGSRSFR